MKNILKRKSFLSIFFAFIIFIILFLSTIYFEGINERIKNYFVKLKNNIVMNSSPTGRISQNIVVIKIDEETTNKIGRFPFSRDIYKTLIENINKGGATVIGFDIIFADKTNQEDDEIFSQAIKDAGNIVLGGAFPVIKVGDKEENYVEKPLDIFYENAYNFGYFHLNISENTGTALTFSPSSLFFNDKKLEEKEWFNHFSIALLRAYYGKISGRDYRDFKDSDEYKFYVRPKVGIPYTDVGNNEVFINYIPNFSNGRSINFENYSFVDVYEGKINPEVFRDKIVIIGAAAKGLKDDFITLNGSEFGVFVHANILNTIITKNFIIYFNENFEWLLLFLLIIISIYFNLSRSGYSIIFSNILIALVFLFLYPTIIIFSLNYVLRHIFELFLALPFSITTGNVIKYLTENKNRAKLSKALSEYVSKAIVQEILSNSGNLKLDGEKKKLSIFFSDIEGFTTISEKFSPEELVSFLRSYLSFMSNIILDSNGFINKYEGDAIMALWGAFGVVEQDSYYACFSAVEQQKTLKDLNKVWSKLGFPEIRARIGLHSGEAIVGNIGAVGRKIEFTALGDSVNLASRLEGVNKFYGTLICASEIIYEENKDLFEFRYLDNIQVKGKDKPIKIYELLSKKGELDDEKQKIISEFNIGIKKFQSREFDEAKKIFENIFEKYGDSPSKTYIEKCKYYLLNKPSLEGELVWKFDSK